MYRGVPGIFKTGGSAAMEQVLSYFKEAEKLLLANEFETADGTY